MSIATLTFAVILAFFIWRGYAKGLIGSITPLLSWLIAYPAAIFFTKPVAHWLMAHTRLDGLLVYFIAGSGIFLLVTFAVSVSLNLIAKRVPENEYTSTGSKLGGVLVGMMIGGVAGLLAVYALSLVQKPAEVPVASVSVEAAPNKKPDAENTAAVGALPAPPPVGQLASARDSFIENAAKKLIGSAAATAVDIAVDDKSVTAMTRAFAEDPQAMLGHVQQLTQSGQLQTMLADEKVQSLLTTGEVDALLRNDQFDTFMANPHMQAILNSDDNETSRRDAAEKLVQAWGRVNQIKHDPRVIAIVTDPEFQQQLNAPNKLPLMMNPKLNQLAELIFYSESPRVDGSHNNNIITTDTDPATDKPDTTIYRWTDDEGRVHYSDKPSAH